jgi:hypothetical protein
VLLQMSDEQTGVVQEHWVGVDQLVWRLCALL